MGLAEFGRLAQENPAFDKMIDARQKEIAEQRDNIIVEGRLSGWMVHGCGSKNLALCTNWLPDKDGLYSVIR